MALVGNFDCLTEQDRQEFEKWTRSDDAANLFQKGADKVQQESDAFIERISISYEELQRPFNI
jgi:hypothetical protein